MTNNERTETMKTISEIVHDLKLSWIETVAALEARERERDQAEQERVKALIPKRFYDIIYTSPPKLAPIDDERTETMKTIREIVDDDKLSLRQTIDVLEARERELLETLNRKIDGLEKANELYRKGMESQAELMDKLKQQVREFEAWKLAEQERLTAVLRDRGCDWQTIDEVYPPETTMLPADYYWTRVKGSGAWSCEPWPYDFVPDPDYEYRVWNDPPPEVTGKVEVKAKERL